MKFRVGDRVAVYSETDYEVGDFNPRRYVGVVKDISKNKIRVLLDQTPGEMGLYENNLVFHPEQCRRLAKKQRRRLWVVLDKYGGPLAVSVKKCAKGIEFVEVRKKK
jgi:hypothetical protein